MRSIYKSNNRISLLRAKRGLAQKQIANLLGHRVTNQVSRYERGTRLPDLGTAFKLAIIFRLPVDQLFFGTFKDCVDELASLIKDSSRGAKAKHLQIVQPDQMHTSCIFLQRLEGMAVSPRDLDDARSHIKDLIEARSRRMNP